MKKNKLWLGSGLVLALIALGYFSSSLLVKADAEAEIENGLVFNNDDTYVYSSYKYSLEEYNQMYETYGKAMPSPVDRAPDATHIYFAGMDILTKHAVWTSNIPARTTRITTTSQNVTIKNGGTWAANGYWGVIMKDSANLYYYCAKHSLDVVVGNQNIKVSENPKIAQALSYGFNNVKSTAGETVDYGRTQLAVWTALKQLNVSASTLGIYQKVIAAYNGTLAFNSPTFSITKGANNDGEILNNLNMSTYLKFSGNAKYQLKASQLDYAKSKNFNYYLYNATSKKWELAKANTWYQTAKHSHLRLGTTDMSLNLDVKGIEIITDVQYGTGLYVDVANTNLQDLWVAQPLQTKTFTADLTLRPKTGSIRLLKQGKGIDLYEQSIFNETDQPYYASKDGALVIYEDGTPANILKYPSKEEMIKQDLFNKPIKYEYFDYDYVTEEKIVLDEHRQPILINDEQGLSPHEEGYIATYQKENMPKRDSVGNALVKMKLNAADEPIVAEATLPFNYPSRTMMDNIYPLKHVKFTLSGNGVQQTKETAADGTVMFNDLLPATYTIKEIATSEGFKLLTNTYTCKVSAGSICAINNNQAIINEQYMGDLLLTKRDTQNKPVQGVIFDIYGLDEEGLIDYDNYLDSVITDEKGLASWSGVPQRYALVEKYGPEKYVIDTEVRYFEIIADETTPLLISNKLKYDEVYVFKQDETKKSLAGATLCVMSKDKSALVIKEFGAPESKTFDKGEMCWTSTTKSRGFSLALGEYYLYEKKAPFGYKKTKQSYPFSVVGEAQVHNFTIINKALKIPKTGHVQNYCHVSLTLNN